MCRLSSSSRVCSSYGCSSTFGMRSRVRGCECSIFVSFHQWQVQCEVATCIRPLVSARSIYLTLSYEIYIFLVVLVISVVPVTHTLLYLVMGLSQSISRPTEDDIESSDQRMYHEIEYCIISCYFTCLNFSIHEFSQRWSQSLLLYNGHSRLFYLDNHVQGKQLYFIDLWANH